MPAPLHWDPENECSIWFWKFSIWFLVSLCILNVFEDQRNICFRSPHQNKVNIYLEAKHLDIDQSEGVVGCEEAADAEDELAGEVPQLRQKAVQEEGQGQAAHRDRNTCG